MIAAQVQSLLGGLWYGWVGHSLSDIRKCVEIHQRGLLKLSTLSQISLKSVRKLPGFSGAVEELNYGKHCPSCKSATGFLGRLPLRR